KRYAPPEASLTGTFGLFWKITGTDFLNVCAGGFNQFVSKLGILTDKWRDSTVMKSKRIVTDQNLSVAIRAGADSDRWNFQTRSHLFREFPRYRFQHNRKRPGLLKRLC